MLLLKTLGFFLDGSQSGMSGGQSESQQATAAFTVERLSSSAWEGWWHDADPES